MSRWALARPQAAPASLARWDHAAIASTTPSPRASSRPLGKELIHRRGWPTRRQPIGEVFDYIETFYNRRRHHSTLGMLAPAQHEAKPSHSRPQTRLGPQGRDCPRNRGSATRALRFAYRRASPSPGFSRAARFSLRARVQVTLRALRTKVRSGTAVTFAARVATPSHARRRPGDAPGAGRRPRPDAGANPAGRRARRRARPLPSGVPVRSNVPTCPLHLPRLLLESERETRSFCRVVAPPPSSTVWCCSSGRLGARLLRALGGFEPDGVVAAVAERLVA